MSRYLYIAAFTCLSQAHSHAIAQQAAEGNVTIHSDPRLSVLLRKGHMMAALAPSSSLSSSAATAHAFAAEATVKPTMTVAATQPALVHTPAATPLVHREQRAVYTGRGYRVQIYNGPDRNKAMTIKTEFMRRFPGVHSYLIYNSPGFRVKIGDFRNRSDAEGMLREANSMFSPSMIVPDIVTISTF